MRYGEVGDTNDEAKNGAECRHAGKNHGSVNISTFGMRGRLRIDDSIIGREGLSGRDVDADGSEDGDQSADEVTGHAGHEELVGLCGRPEADADETYDASEEEGILYERLSISVLEQAR